MLAETPVWRRVDGEYPLCNACGVAKQHHGVHRIPPPVTATPAIALPPLAPIVHVPAAPSVLELPAVPALTCTVPVFKPLARVFPTLPSDFNPFLVDSPSAMRVPAPNCSPFRGKALFAEPRKGIVL